ncbi:hypothetical protein V5799_002851 [Amblyomma americanum]|uniref:Uncharacterized protein n=1 Tax=Amblyomma americanum TaxID=6943 RepID=A0AAQ4DAM3_AMBAM
MHRLGKAALAVISFAGQEGPLTVNYGCSQLRSYMYRKAKAACVNCGMPGHRVDVYPKHRDSVCQNGGKLNCALCKGPRKAYKAYSRDCKDKFYKPVNINTTNTSSKAAVTTKPEEEGRSSSQRRKHPADRRRAASASTSCSRFISRGRGSGSKCNARHVEAGNGSHGVKNQANVLGALKQTHSGQLPGLKVSW